VVGKDVDVSRFAPKAVLTGASWNWGPMMVKLVNEIKAGTWKPSHVRGDLKDGAVVLDKFGPAVPKAVQKTILDRKQDILSGKFVVWAGPLTGQDGKELLPAGKPMEMEMLESMNFFVKGVIGTIK
jgi:basic membrane protein A